MFDIPIRKCIDPIMDRTAASLSGLGLRANTVTWTGLALGLSGAIAVSFGYYWLGLLGIILNRICDGLDGCIARQTSKSDIGGFLDIALDMIFYASIPFAFAVVEAENALAASFLLFSFFGTACSFFAYAVISSNRGVRADQQGKKSFFYSTGLIEGFETTAYLMLICVFPPYFPISAWIMGGLCWVTTCSRIAWAYAEFKTP